MARFERKAPEMREIAAARSGLASGAFRLAAYSLFYVVWVFILFVLSRRIGRFRLWARLLYPVLVSVLLGVFIVSLSKKQFGLKVKWKGRSLSSEET